MTGDRQCSLRSACDTSWPPVRPSLPPVRQQPGIEQAVGSNTGNSTGEGEKNTGGMKWCRSVSGQEEAITRSFKGPLICKQNAAALHKIEAGWKGKLGKYLHSTFYFNCI